MEINQVLDADVLKISVSGELDASSAIEMDEVMKSAFRQGNLKILIDCKELKYISSAGLGVFVSYLDDFNAQKGKFIFHNMSDSVLNVFRILGLDKIMSIVKDEQEAKSMVNES